MVQCKSVASCKCMYMYIYMCVRMYMMYVYMYGRLRASRSLEKQLTNYTACTISSALLANKSVCRNVCPSSRYICLSRISFVFLLEEFFGRLFASRSNHKTTHYQEEIRRLKPREDQVIMWMLILLMLFNVGDYILRLSFCKTRFFGCSAAYARNCTSESVAYHAGDNNKSFKSGGLSDLGHK